MEVYVVTNPELGWDCVCDVFPTHEEAQSYVDDETGYDLVAHGPFFVSNLQEIREEKIGEVLTETDE